MYIPQNEIHAAVKKVLKGEVDINDLHEALKIEVKLVIRARENVLRAAEEYKEES